MSRNEGWRSPAGRGWPDGHASPERRERVPEARVRGLPSQRGPFAPEASGKPRPAKASPPAEPAGEDIERGLRAARLRRVQEGLAAPRTCRLPWCDKPVPDRVGKPDRGARPAGAVPSTRPSECGQKDGAPCADQDDSVGSPEPGGAAARPEHGRSGGSRCGRRGEFCTPEHRRANVEAVRVLRGLALDAVSLRVQAVGRERVAVDVVCREVSRRLLAHGERQDYGLREPDTSTGPPVLWLRPGRTLDTFRADWEFLYDAVDALRRRDGGARAGPALGGDTSRDGAATSTPPEAAGTGAPRPARPSAVSAVADLLIAVRQLLDDVVPHAPTDRQR